MFIYLILSIQRFVWFLSPQGVVGSSSGIAWFINLPEQSKLKLVGGHNAKITAISFSADSSHIASASADGSLVVWDLATREQLVVFQVPHKVCSCVTFAPSRRGKEQDNVKNFKNSKMAIKGCRKGRRERIPLYIMAGYSDGMLRVFDMARATLVKKMQPYTDEVRALSYSQDGNHCILCCRTLCSLL